jgi:hypothetical protein
MAKLEDLKQGAQVKGIDPTGSVTAYPLKTSFDRKRGRQDGKTTTLEPKNGFQKR